MAKKRRANGEGSIFQRKDGLWAAQYTDNVGKKRTLYGKSQQAVRLKMKEAIKESDQGIQVDKNKITFAEWLEEWLEIYVKPSVRPSSYALYYRCIYKYVIPAFPKVMLKDLRADMLQKFFIKLSVDGKIRVKKDPNTGKLIKDSGGLSYNTLKRYRITLVTALNRAIDVGIITQNPASKVKLPSPAKKEVRILSVEEQKRLEAVLLSSDRPICFAVYLVLYTGLRIGELTGLRESDIDLEKWELSVKRSISRIEIPETGKTEMVISSGKTANSERTIPLPPFVAELLKEYIANTGEAREILRYAKSMLKSNIAEKCVDDDYLFLSRVGKPFDAVAFRSALDESLQKAGVEHINFHALRHTFITRCVEAGFDVRTLADIVGHSDASLTLNVYAHAMDEQKKRNMDKLTPIYKQESDNGEQ